MFKKVKSLLIVFVFVLMSSMLFVACDEQEYEVSSIAFKEDKIMMIVGQEYTPSVSVLPSYASNKGYHFEIMGNNDIVSVVGKQLTALKEGSVQLKVIADDNQYLEDVVVIKVLPSPIDLNVPTALRFDGNLISFSPVENATAYNLFVNDQKLVLQGKTSISIDEMGKSLSTNLLDKVVNIQVQAVGDSRITMPSQLSDTLSILKISQPNDFKLENNVLSFNKVAGVKEYAINFLQNQKTVLSFNVSDEDFAEDVVRLDVNDYVDSFVGGEYVCELICTKNNYSTLQDVEIFASNSLSLGFEVLSVPANFKMSNNVLYWDKVVGADYYVLLDSNGNVFANNVEKNSFDLTNYLENSHTYSYRVVACSNNKSVVSKLKLSNVVEFSVLDNPEIQLDVENGVVEWASVANAVAYGVTVESNGSKVASQVITSNQFDLTDLASGGYVIKVASYGDGVGVLNAKTASEIEFSVQDTVKNVKLENKVITWQADDGAKFKLEIKNPLGNVVRSELLTGLSYSLSAFVLSPGEYTYTIQCVSQANSLASKKVQKSFYKLEEIENIVFAGNVLKFETGLKTVDTKVECNKLGESQSIELNKVKLNEYTLDTTSLTAGDYTISVYALGDKQNVFDADNIDRTITITKLSAPTISADTVNRTIELSSEVALASGYELYENDVKVTTFGLTQKVYSVNQLLQGSYEYKVKAIGNGTNYIDSNISSVQAKVLRLDTPVLTFDKATKKFNIATEQNEYINEYKFSLDGEDIAVIDNKVDCSDSTRYFKLAKKYQAKAILNSKTSFGEYDLILSSKECGLEISKIDASANLSMSNGKIYITPTGFSISDNYIVSLQLGYNDNGEFSYVPATNVVVENGKYVIDAVDSNYNPIGTLLTGKPVFAEGNIFNLKWSISTNEQTVLDSEEYSIGNVSKRDAVSKLVRNGQNITFDAVEGAVEYLYSITTDKVYYAYTNNTSIAIRDLVNLFAGVGLEIVDGISYDLKIVALGNDQDLVLPAWGTQTLSFKILDQPTAEIKLNQLGEKIIEIPCNIVGAEKFNLVFSDKTSTYMANLNCVGNSITYLLSSVIGLGSGDINVSIKAVNTSGNFFDSDAVQLTYQVLSRPTLTIENGLLVCEKNEDANSYLLYYNDTSWNQKSLSLVDFVESNGKLYYNMRDVVSGFCQIKLKAISKLRNEDTYLFDSPDSEVVQVLKLSKPTLSIVSGEIKIDIAEKELSYVNNVVITNNQTQKEIDILTVVDDLSSEMTIQPEKLLQYLSETAIEEESFEIKLFAKNLDDTTTQYLLNSEPLSVKLSGLKPVDDIHIKTSVNYDDDGETIDKISWTNNTNNTGLVKGYLVEIEYCRSGNSEPIKHSHLVEGETVNYYTFPNVEGFGAGDYKIRIKTLAKDSSGYVNSSFSEDYIFSLTTTPINLQTFNGKISWDIVAGANEYLVRVYDNEDAYLECKKVYGALFDFNTLGNDYGAGAYKVSVQAINEINPNVVSSAESEKLVVVKLPEINKYKLEMGALYVYTHSFVDKIALTLTGKTIKFFEGTASSTLTELNGQSWGDIDVDSILSDESSESVHKMTYKKFEIALNGGNTTEILDCLSDGYTLTLQALGNTAVELATVDSNVTNSKSGEDLINDNLTDTRQLIKTQMPMVTITSRGVASWSMVATTYADMNYNGLTDMLIYDVLISVKGKDHSFLVADNVDINNLPEGVTYVPFGELDRHTYYGYLRYNNQTEDTTDDLIINVMRYVDETQFGNLAFDFNLNYIYYVLRNVDGESGNIVQGEITLSKGGNFDIAIRVLGDSTKYLTSNNSISKTMIRYEQLVLGVEDGYLTWKDLKYGSDSPIYLLKITNTGNNEVNYIYLYEESAGDVFTMPIFVEGHTYKQIAEYTHKQVEDDTITYIKYMFDTLNGTDYLFGENKYKVDLTTYYRDSTSLEALESQSSPMISLSKYKQIELTLYRGDLFWEQTEIPSTTGMIYDYEITAKTSEQKIVFRISQSDYAIENGYIKYTLPETVEDITTGELVSFRAGVEYVFTIKALATTNISYINSNDSAPLATEVNDTVVELSIEDSKLVWQYDQDGVFVVELTYSLDNQGENVVKYETEVNGKYFALPTTIEDSIGTRDLTSSYLYSFRIKKLGGNSLLSGFYSVSCSAEKLKTVSSVSSNKGVVEWDRTTSLNGDTISDVKYEIIFEDSSMTVEMLDSNSFDFADYANGTIKFYIVAHHNDYFDSDISELLTFNKLGVVTGGTEEEPNFQPIKDENGVLNTLIWNSVSVNGYYADKYAIEVCSAEDTTVLYEKSFVLTEEEKVAKQIRFNIAELGIDISNMRVRIRAMSDLNESTLINGEWSEYFSLSKADEIDVSTFEINGLYAEWRQIATEQSTDSYVLQYSYQKDRASVAQEYTFVLNSTDSNNYRLVTSEEGNYKVYFYKFYMVGIYNNIRVTVNRTGLMSSNPVVMVFEEADGAILPVEYTLNLFSSGDGTAKNPYIIANAEQFGNINNFPTSYYQLANNISLSNKQITSIKEFGGVFDGNNKIISNAVLSSSGNYLGIFEQTIGTDTENAVIKNLTLTYISATLTSSYVDSAMYGGLLIGKAQKTTIDNVVVSNSVLNITVRDSLNDYTTSGDTNFYFGGLVGYLDSSSIANFTVNLLGLDENSTTASIIAIYGQNRDNLYFGGIAGYSMKSNIAGSSDKKSSVAVEYSIVSKFGEGKTTYPSSYVGGVVGVFDSDKKTDGIKYINVTVKQTKHSLGGEAPLYQAGVCAYIKYGCIENVVVSGEIGANLESTTFTSIYLGKIVANYNSNVVEYIINNTADDLKLSYTSGKVIEREV